MEGLDYISIGMMILVFIVQLIIIWYMYWIYTQLNNDYNDLEDMVVDIYNITAADLKLEGTEVAVKLPKRTKARLAKRNKLINQSA